MEVRPLGSLGFFICLYNKRYWYFYSSLKDFSMQHLSWLEAGISDSFCLSLRRPRVFLQLHFLKILFIYFYRERKGGKNRGRVTSISCLSPEPKLGTKLEAQICVLTGNWTSDISTNWATPVLTSFLSALYFLWIFSVMVDQWFHPGVILLFKNIESTFGLTTTYSSRSYRLSHWPFSS